MEAEAAGETEAESEPVAEAETEEQFAEAESLGLSDEIFPDRPGYEPAAEEETVDTTGLVDAEEAPAEPQLRDATEDEPEAETEAEAEAEETAEGGEEEA